MSSEQRSTPSVGATAKSEDRRRLRIGDVAERSAVSVDTLRFYERRGLIRPIARRASGYREYEPEVIQLVRFIRRAQALGFTLTEVEELVRLREGAWAGDAPAQLREAAVTKVRDIDQRVRDLRRLRGALAQLISACDKACPVGFGEQCEDTTTLRVGAAQKVSAAKPAPLDCPLIEALDADEIEWPAEDLRRHAVHTSRSPTPGRRVRQKQIPARDPSSSKRRKP